MKTLDQFTSDWLGKKCDFDGAYGGQCVDLYRMYVKEVLGFMQSPSVTGASLIWDTYLQDKFDRIPNTPSGVPSTGDIVIWSNKAGAGYGHVDIFLSGDANSFIGLDQNWPTLSVVTKTKHDYANVLGWLHPKVVYETSYRGLDLTNVDSMKVCVDDHLKIVEGQLVDRTQYETLKGQFTELQKQNDDLSTQLGSVRAEVKALTAVIESKTQAIDLLSKEDVVQLETLKREELRANTYSDKYFNVLVTIREQLKLSSTIEDEEIAESEAYNQLGSLNQTIASYELQVKDLQAQVKKLTIAKKPIDKLTTKEMLKLIITKLFGGTV